MAVQVKTLNQLHPSLDPTWYDKIRQLYTGGKSWHEHVGEWLPQQPMEPPKVWAFRKARATYQNIFGGVVDFYPAYVFSAQPKIASTDAFYVDLQTSTDGGNEKWSTFWSNALTDMLLDQRVWIWVNLPKAQETVDGEPVAFTDLAAQTASGALNAHLKRMKAENVRDFVMGDDGLLEWIVFHEAFSERKQLNEPRVNVHHWTFIDRANVTVYEWRQGTGANAKDAPGPEDVADELGTMAHGLKNAVPVIPLEVKRGLWLGEKLFDPVVSLLRGRNDLDWGLYHVAHPLLVLISKKTPESPTLGAGHYFRLSRDQEGSDDAKYLEPPGTNLKTLAADVDRRRTEVFRTAHQMAMAADPSAAEASRSGSSKVLDYKMTEIICDAYAQVIEDGMVAALRMIAQIRAGMGAPDVLAITGMEARNRPSLEVFLNSLVLATDAKQMSATFRKEAAKAQAERVIGTEIDDETMKKIREEIEAAPDDLSAMFGFGSPDSMNQDPDDVKEPDEPEE